MKAWLKDSGKRNLIWGSRLGGHGVAHVIGAGTESKVREDGERKFVSLGGVGLCKESGRFLPSHACHGGCTRCVIVGA